MIIENSNEEKRQLASNSRIFNAKSNLLIKKYKEVKKNRLTFRFSYAHFHQHRLTLISV